MATPIIQLESSDGKKFFVEYEIAMYFGILKTLFESGMCNQYEERFTIPLRNVTSNILQRVLQWAIQHKKSNNDDISLWENDFLNVDRDTLLALRAAADYLDIQDLYIMTSKLISN